MWLIDLSSGVSSTALLIALIRIESNNANIILNQLESCLESQKNILKIMNDINFTFDLSLNILKDKLKGLPILDEVEIYGNTGKYTEQMCNILETAERKTLDSFQLFVYLSLLILLNKYSKKNEVFLSIPKIGVKSSTVSLNLLKNKCIQLSEMSLPISDILAAMFSIYVNTFIENIVIELLDVVEIIDPCNQSLKIRVLKGKDPLNSLNSDIVTVLEANIDDTTPEILSSAMDQILKSGALDYTVIPVSMKKNRTGFQIQVLCNLKDTDNIINQLFKWTSTFGIRKTIVNRIILDRCIEDINTSLGKVRIKKGLLGNKIVRISPEFEDILRISRETGNSTQNIYSLIFKELKINID